MSFSEIIILSICHSCQVQSQFLLSFKHGHGDSPYSGEESRDAPISTSHIGLFIDWIDRHSACRNESISAFSEVSRDERVFFVRRARRIDPWTRATVFVSRHEGPHPRGVSRLKRQGKHQNNRFQDLICPFQKVEGMLFNSD